jgi:hypothetical protein
VVVVRDAAHDGAAQAAMNRLLAAGRVSPRAAGRGAATIKVVRGQYTFAELARWRDTLFTNVLASDIPGVRSLDLDEARNRVVLGLASESFASTRASVLAQLPRLGVNPAAVLFDSAGGERQDQSSGIPLVLNDPGLA